jgi:tetratricopeptide (TPR) repeat protein
MGERAFLSTTAAFLARAIYAQGRDDEAEHFAEQSAELAATGDLATHVLWRGVRARILAKRGSVEEAEALARDAVTLAEKSDFLDIRADSLVDLGLVLRESRRYEQARAAVSEALRLYVLKGNSVSARTARSSLADLSTV